MRIVEFPACSFMLRGLSTPNIDLSRSHGHGAGFAHKWTLIREYRHIYRKVIGKYRHIYTRHSCSISRVAEARDMARILFIKKRASIKMGTEELRCHRLQIGAMRFARAAEAHECEEPLFTKQLCHPLRRII